MHSTGSALWNEGATLQLFLRSLAPLQLQLLFPVLKQERRDINKNNIVTARSAYLRSTHDACRCR
jgi:hypothetical protein